jgi:predicted P-loop ATPase
MHDRPALIPPVAVGLPAWRGKILVTEDGLAHSGAAARNAEIALTEDPAFAGAIRYDALRGEVMVCGPLPWAPRWLAPRPWEETDDTRAQLWLQDQGIFIRSRRAVADIVDVIAEDGIYHPIVDHFRPLGWPSSPRWDGDVRVGGDDHPSWLSRYCGVEDSPYTRAIGQGWALLAVAWLFDPGCRAPVLVLGGAGVENKAAVFKILGGEFFGQVSAFAVKHRNPLPERQRSAWIIEITGLDQLRRLGEWRGVVEFAAREADEFLDRGRRQRRLRPCVFGASTEREDGLPEHADARSWYFVHCSAIDVDALIRDRDQFWTEALVRYGARTIPEISNPIGKLPRIGIGAMRDGVAILRQYLSERCEGDRAAMIAKDTLLADYNEWRSTCGLAPLTKHWLGRHLKRAAPELHDYRPEKRPFEDRRQHYYRGLRVISGRRG